MYEEGMQLASFNFQVDCKWSLIQGCYHTFTTLHMYLSCKIIIKKKGSEEVTNFKAKTFALSCALKITVTEHYLYNGSWN